MDSFFTRILHFLPPEMSHHLVIKLLRFFPVKNVIADIDLSIFSQTLMGIPFSHPLGLGAGFDKDAEVYDKLGQMGFSFLEVGSVVPLPQPGNPKPRLFRLPSQKAIINRYGFNSKGMNYVAGQLEQYPHSCAVGVNLGKNKDTINEANDYLQCVKALVRQADYFVINVSSPNTPGLRELGTPERIKPIITGIRAITREFNRTIPLLVKLSPDMPIREETVLVEFLMDQVIEGIIVSNTTIRREGIEDVKGANEEGGLSGPPLKNRSLTMLRRIYQTTQGRVALIGCGGISTGADAYERLRAGANLLQIYTAFIYQGPQVIRKILLELKSLLERDGVKSVGEIVGAG